MARPRLLSVPPGVPFLPTFVRALLAGDIMAGVSRADGPFALADTTIYVPTRRAARALVAEFASQIEDSAILLPTIRPLGAVDEETALFADPTEPAFALDPDLPGAIGEIERRFLLADMVLAWSRALRGAIVSARPDGELTTDEADALVVGAGPADALALAGDLAGLIDEFIVEGAAWSSVRDLVADDYDSYWGITTRFLRIAIEQWPAILAERGQIDAADRRAKLIEREIARLSTSGGADRTIVLGSTGTNRATASLMRKIARLPFGAVVLPGLDQTMPPKDWRIVAGADEGAESAFGHPQAALARLLGALGATREDVRALAAPVDALEQRRRFVAQALAPSETTPDWRGYIAACGESLDTALDRVELIEAADEREEALAIAIRLREVLETPGKTGALITPDRTIARRVRAEFARWGLEIDDSGGEALSVTKSGAFSRAALTAASEGSDVSLAALLAHRDVAPVHERARTEGLARMLEIGVLRVTPRDPDWPRRIGRAREAAGDRHAHPAARRICDDDWREICALVAAVDVALAPLRAQNARRPIAEWISLHRACLAKLGARSTVERGEDGRALDLLFDEVGSLGAEAGGGMSVDLVDYHALFESLATSATVRGPQRSHARIKILGLLEARLLDADLVVLGGLDETIWPPRPKTDAFLNRPMRAQIGLTPPERRIGQSAHDFTMGMGAPQVVLARALKRGRAPTVASRFVQRLAALGGDAFEQVRTRGARWIELAREIDRPEPAPPIARPEPAPSLELRPVRLSVTRIETLRRDPYSIYADRVLELQPVKPFDFVIGAAEQGTAVHAALNELTTRWRSGGLPLEAREILAASARKMLAPFFADPAWRAFRWPAIEAGLDFVLLYESERRAEIVSVYGEAAGRTRLALADGSEFTLSAVADRIEIDRDGHARIVDYKTGTPPSLKQVKAGFASQLTLEAEMARRGAFEALGVCEADSGAYLKIGGRDGGKLVELKSKDWNFVDLAAKHWAELNKLLSSYRDPARGYASRPLAQYASKFGDYDHLARVKEWSATGGATEGET